MAHGGPSRKFNSRETLMRFVMTLSVSSSRPQTLAASSQLLPKSDLRTESYMRLPRSRLAESRTVSLIRA